MNGGVFLPEDSPLPPRKVLAPRKPCGQLKREPRDSRPLAPIQVRRLLDAAAEGLRDPLWGSMIGRLHLNGKISSAELATAKHWARIVANYSAACCSPRPPRTVPLDAIGGTPVDPDSATGERGVRRHERASAAWLEGRNALRLAGRDAERVVDSVCARDCALAGFGELNALRAGLQALAALWSAKRKASAR